MKFCKCEVCKQEKQVICFLPGNKGPYIPLSKLFKICEDCVFSVEGKKFLESDLLPCDKEYTVKQMCEHLAKYLKEHKHEWMMNKFGKEMSGEDIYNSYPSGDLVYIQTNFLAVCSEIGYPIDKEN